MALSRIDLAEAELGAAVKRNGLNSRARCYLGRLWYKNFLDEAIETTRTALKLDPAIVRAYDNLALCYEALHRYEDAKKAYPDCVERQRQSGEPIEWPSLNLGAMLIKDGDPAAAKTYFEEGLRINPRSREAHFRLGSVLESEKELSGAVSSTAKRWLAIRSLRRPIIEAELSIVSSAMKRRRKSNSLASSDMLVKGHSAALVRET